MPKAPRWSVGDVVYLKESAMIGFIESYKITNIAWDPQWNRWVYMVDIKHKGAESTSVIDMYDLRRSETLRFIEDDLISCVEALDLAIINLKERLKYLQNKRDALN